MTIDSNIANEKEDDKILITIDGVHPMFDVDPKSVARVLCKGFEL
jgi:hypothetical protein